jgi:hypothetical protein
MPMVRVTIHPALKRFTDKNVTNFNVNPCRAGELLSQICEQHPRLEKAVMRDGKLLPYVVLYINEQPFSVYSSDAVLPENAEVQLITALVGG